MLAIETCLSFILGLSISFFVHKGYEPQTPSATLRQPRSKREPKPTPKPEEVPSLNIEEFDVEDDDRDLRKAMVALNESAMAEFDRELHKTAPWADLSLLFIRWGRIYPSSC